MHVMFMSPRSSLAPLLSYGVWVFNRPYIKAPVRPKRLVHVGPSCLPLPLAIRLVLTGLPLQEIDISWVSLCAPVRPGKTLLCHDAEGPVSPTSVLLVTPWKLGTPRRWVAPGGALHSRTKKHTQNIYTILQQIRKTNECKCIKGAYISSGSMNVS